MYHANITENEHYTQWTEFSVNHSTCQKPKACNFYTGNHHQLHDVLMITPCSYKYFPKMQGAS